MQERLEMVNEFERIDDLIGLIQDSHEAECLPIGKDETLGNLRKVGVTITSAHKKNLVSDFDAFRLWWVLGGAIDKL